MSTAPHPLSAVETEALRQMRTRLAKAPASDAAAATLGRAFLQVAARSGFGAQADPAGLAVVQATLGPDLRGLVEALDGAGLPTLGLYSAVLQARGEASPAEWRRMLAAGLPQALIGRRLQLAGRERVEPRT